MWLACLIYFYLVYTKKVSLPCLMSLILFWQHFHAWTQLTCQVTLIGKSLFVSPPEVPLWEKTPSHRGFRSILQVALRFLRNPSFRCLFKTVQAGWLRCFVPNSTPFCVLCHGALCHGACLSMSPWSCSMWTWVFERIVHWCYKDRSCAPDGGLGGEVNLAGIKQKDVVRAKRLWSAKFSLYGFGSGCPMSPYKKFIIKQNL